MEKEKDKQIKLNEEKTLEEVLTEKNYSFSSQEFDNIIQNIKVIKKIGHDFTAKEYLKQIILSGEDIKQYLNENKVTLKENYNNTLIKKLETLAQEEKTQYNELMKPFIEEGKLEENFCFSEKFKLGLYKFFNNFEKHDELYDSLFERETLNSLKETKEGLKHELERANNLTKDYQSELTNDKQKAKYILQKLERTQKSVETANRTLSHLETEKSSLEKILEEKNENLVLDQDSEDKFEKMCEDIENIQEESLDALESADINKLKVVDIKININEKNQLKTFYKDMGKSYVRHIDILSNLILKIKKGMSYTRAHELIKKFVQYDTPISIYMNIRKTELERYNKETLKINPPYIRENTSNISIKRDNLDYKLRMEEGAAELKEFLKDFKRH
jgi:hypothetical protein